MRLGHKNRQARNSLEGFVEQLETLEGTTSSDCGKKERSG